MNKAKAFLLLFISFRAFAFAQSPAAPATAVASRMEGTTILYYSTLHEAIEAAAGTFYLPDEITLLADITVYAPLEIDAGKYIRLVPGYGTSTIMRGQDFVDYPVIWVSGDDSSISLGKPGMENELVIDGGYLTASEGSLTSIQAHAPLAVVNGRNAKLIMYDGVSLQNNYNFGQASGVGRFQNGSGVFIRTVDDDMENVAEFIMKGGTIQGNTNDVQNPVACGGGVFIAGFGLFSMEGGVIMNNAAYISGGGFHTGSRGSFKKTGGIIYGNNAPEGYRNTVTYGVGSPVVFGHAVCVANLDGTYNYRNDTIGKTDNLSYTGSPRENGVFGTGEKWFTNAPNDNSWITTIIMVILSAAALGACAVILWARNRRKHQGTESVLLPQIDIDELNIELSSKEKNVLDLLFTDLSFKQIADTLNLSREGVKYHNKKIYSKLGVSNRTELLVKYKKK